MMLRRRLISLVGAAALLVPLVPAGAVAADPPPVYPPSEAPASIVLYESQAQLAALAEASPTVLFFFASWCPNCQAAIQEFQTRWDEARPGLVLVIADYDQEAALKARYGVAFQDTYVQIAPDGERLKIWNGGGLDTLNANLAGLATLPGE